MAADSTETKRNRGAPLMAADSAPRVIIQSDPKARDPITAAAPRTAWRLLGWFGLLLVVVGTSDLVSQWYPTAFHSPEWEFTTSAVTIGSLPLLTIGVTVMLASFLARANREGVIGMGAVFLVLFLVIGTVMLLFALDVPLALRTPPGPALTAIKKAIARTTVMGLSYEVAYLVAAVVAFRYAFGRVRDG